MLNPISRKEKQLLLFATSFLLMGTTSAGSSTTYRPRHILPAGSPSINYTLVPDTLKNAKLSKKDNKTTRYVHTQRNSDLVIAIPDAHKMKYRVRFFDGQNHFLFEIAQVQDSLLVIEKYNFHHAGQFQYELYKENILMEKNTFLIKKD